MKDFQPGGRLQNLRRKFLRENAISGEAEPRAQPFSADSDHIPQRIIQPRGPVLEFNPLKQLLQSLIDDAFRYHNANVVKNVLFPVPAVDFVAAAGVEGRVLQRDGHRAADALGRLFDRFVIHP